MEEEKEIEIAVDDLLTTLQNIAAGIKSIDERLTKIEDTIVADHEKIEELEAHTVEDHQKLEDLERTGRITVRPVGI